MSVLHQLVSDIELEEWIVDDVRRHIGCRHFTTSVTFARLHSAYSSGATWEIDTVTARSAWSTPCREAFDIAVRAAQRAFDLTD